MTDAEVLDQLVESVRAGAGYQQVDAGLVRRVAQAELSKGHRPKEAVKSVRSKLHQAGGAYRDPAFNAGKLIAELETLPRDPQDASLRDFCRKAMIQHASTRERLPMLDDFYARVLENIGPLQTVLDMACGLNPLALPWLPLAPGAQVFACDIYNDIVALAEAFRQHLGLDGRAWVCDLSVEIPSQPVQLALALKTIPCLEQLDKKMGTRLLSGLDAEHLMVSFPGRSLGGRSKGMVQNYTSHFEQLTAGFRGRIQRFDFPNELVYLLSR